jgi:cell wall-associated NlpC family hydrolase
MGKLFVVWLTLLLVLVPLIAVAGQGSTDPIVVTTVTGTASHYSFGEVVGTLPFPPGESTVNGLAWSEEDQALWVTGFTTRRIYKVNPANGAVLTSLPTPGASAPSDNTWDGQALWHSDFSTNTVYRLHPVTGQVLTSFTPPGPAFGTEGLAWDGTGLWMGNGFDRTLYKTDTLGRVISRCPAPGQAEGADGLAFDHANGFLYVLGYEQRIYRIDPTTCTVLRGPVPPSIRPIETNGAAFDGTFLWVADNNSRRLLQIDVEAAPLTLGEKAAELAKAVIGAPYLGDGSTWGGKGWEYAEQRYVEPAEIKTGYRFWNNNINVRKQDFGAGLDCSGLILWSYNKAAGANDYVPTPDTPCSIPICYENADGQFRSNTQVVSGNIQPGDLLFFNFSKAGYNPQCLNQKNTIKCATHVAMYVGGNDVVEAPSPGGKIKISDFNTLKEKIIPQGIRRIIPNPDIGFIARAGSPISLIVTDPDDFTISVETFIQTDEEYSREIPGNLYYVEAVLGTDGKPNARVYAPNLKIGNYLIKPVPLPDARSSDTYSIEVEAAGTVIVLAKNTPITTIPSQGYGVQSTGAVISQFIPIVIDIKPGSSDNPINPKSNGRIPVAILSSTTFNAPREVDVTSLSFGRTGNEKSLSFCNTGGEDVNGDGLLDIMCHFDNKTAAFRSGDTQGILNGKTVNTIPVTGKDSVRIVP